MKKYGTDDIRNVALLSHGGHGTTSLGEAILFNSGAINRLGSVDAGSSVLDFEEEEQNRKSSIAAGVASCEFNQTKLNIIDLPGLADFVGDVNGAMRVADGAVLVVSAVDGVEVRTERLWSAAGEHGMARAIFINKMDRERANFQDTLDDIRDTLGVAPVTLTVPIGAEGNLRGVVDLIDNRALYYSGDGTGEPQVGDIPADIADEITELREAFVEDIAGTNEALMEHYFEEGGLDGDTIRKALGPALRNGLIVPVFAGSATGNVGVDQLMRFISGVMPSPADCDPVVGRRAGGEEEVSFQNHDDAPFSAFVFKTMADKYTGQLSLMRIYSGSITSDTAVHNATQDHAERFGSLLALRGKEQTTLESAHCGDIIAVAKLKSTSTGDTLSLNNAPIVYSPIQNPPPAITLAIKAARQGDEDKVYQGLLKLAEADPSLRLTRDADSGTLLSGMGQLHIDATLKKLASKYNVSATTATPKIPYRETIRGSVTDVRYRHKKQSGGKGQFAEVLIDITPQERGAGFDFEDAIVGGAIPRGFVPAVEKGVVETMGRGVLAGYPVVDVKVRLHDGKHHEVDSSEMAFKIAASRAFKDAVRSDKARAVLLEPVMQMEVTVPEENLGDVMGDLSSRRGRPMGMEARGKYQVIKAQAPMSEVLRYSPDLRSMTGGRGDFVMRMSHYEQVPRDISAKLMASFTDEDDD